MKREEADEFFALAAVRAGNMNAQTCRDAYFGVLRLLLEKCKYGAGLELPDLGHFVVKRRKARRMVNVNTGLPVMIEGVNELKFTPDYRLKKYIREAERPRID
jgi:nucleoid DNA-binding protein